jgi:hypothetical protein
MAVFQWVVRLELRIVGLLSLLLACELPLAGQILVSSTERSGDFPLAAKGAAATIWHDAADYTVVTIAATELAEDVERVTNLKPQVVTSPEKLGATPVLVGTLGKSLLVDRLVNAGKLDVKTVAGQWETFLIATVENPLPGVRQALVIAGSDRRGTAYGVFELSEKIGVSPWYWWADVHPRKSAILYVKAGATQVGPPSVKFRGIFINDEDWGLQPWAAYTYDPDLGDIGPKTYRRIFELMLRLKANTLWPAMHAVTKAFNIYPQDKFLADDFAIVMASSHAEPMLRTNTTEWRDAPEKFDYADNPEGVTKYWEERVKENGRFENIWTVGIRGIHDSPMVGVRTMRDKVNLLEKVFADQRALLKQYVNPNVEQVPQAFTPYKEVLPIYRAGLKVPDDVTIVWPDDNFGYIREFPQAFQRNRAGGFGVYYHISYLGSPQSYLWLNTTPPALIWEEMSKAYDLGARRLWILNVGDIKPGEIGISFFLEMAWDITRWRRDTQQNFLRDWAARTFGPDNAEAVADVLADYYKLNYQRKPEHLHWMAEKYQFNWGQVSPFTEREVWTRLKAFQDLRRRVEELNEKIPDAQRDSFYELVAYPIYASASYNERYFYSTEYLRAFNTNTALARSFAARARAAQTRLEHETARFNHEIAGGKWNRIMAMEPADDQVGTVRHQLPAIPAENQVPPEDKLMPDPSVEVTAMSRVLAAPYTRSKPAATPAFIAVNGMVAIEAENFTNKVDRNGVAWQIIPELGRIGSSVAPYPVTAAGIPEAKLADESPRLEYHIDFPAGGKAGFSANLVPTFPVAPGTGIRFAVGIDKQPPQIITLQREAETGKWLEDVLNNTMIATAQLNVPSAGTHMLCVYMIDPGVAIDRLVLDMGGLKSSYLGPEETREQP